MKDLIHNEIESIVNDILIDYHRDRDVDQIDMFNEPDRDMVIDIVKKLQRIVFPGYYREKSYRSYTPYGLLSVLIEDVMYNLNKQITIVLRYDKEFADADYEVLSEEAQKRSIAFFRTIPKIRDYVNTDLQATFDGDPAADSKEDIILSYPGIQATTINRIAHELFLLNVPLLPRMMTEYAHSITGIDIHPGATIGKYFCIDHGTGVVVGSTSTIGEHVKLYQGVTIGALSTRLGQAIHDVKRHPTIEDYVTIYSNASILGGETVIGRGAVIGGNCFITSSVKPGTRVSVKSQELLYVEGRKAPIRKDFDQEDNWS